MSKETKVAVTGASGFVGTYLLEDLVQEGFDVIALSRSKPKVKCTWKSIDYSLPSLSDALMNVDVVVHLAGRRMTRDDDLNNISPFISANVEMLADLVDACKKNKVKKIIYSSTIAVYGASITPPYSEASLPTPLNAYALTKLIGEEYLDMLTRKTNLEVISLRFAAIYGHGEKDTPVLMKFAKLASEGKELKLIGNSNYCIDQLYVVDAINSIKSSIKEGNTRGVFNIGSGVVSTVRDIAKSVNNQFGNVGNLNDDSVVDSKIIDSTMNISKARKLLGWQPLYDLESGLKDFNHRRMNKK